ILLGVSLPGGGWTMTPGPRLKAGEHPIATTVADVFGDGREDILVVNQDSDSLTVLLGLGGGFFDDQHPWTLATGLRPVQAFVVSGVGGGDFRFFVGAEGRDHVIQVMFSFEPIAPAEAPASTSTASDGEGQGPLLAGSYYLQGMPNAGLSQGGDRVSSAQGRED